MKKLKNKGYLLIEVLFSIALLAIVASVLIPNFITILNNNTRVSEKEKLYNYAFSQMEIIIANNYNTGEILNISGNEKYDVNIVSKKNENYIFLNLIVKDKKTNEECKLEMVLPQKRIYSS